MWIVVLVSSRAMFSCIISKSAVLPQSPETKDEKKDKDFFSQGEFRITNLSLIMTINHLLFDKYSFSPLMIFDDLFSELDDEVVNSVFKYFLHLKNQIFITSTSEPLNYSPTRQFQVVEGQLV